MRGWLATDHQAVIFETDSEVVAYALYRDDGSEIYLRQFFVVRHRRRQGLGRKAMLILFDDIWPKDKRLTVEVLWKNKPAMEFWKSVGYEERSLALEIPPNR
jgi:predicted acetyltransferase